MHAVDDQAFRRFGIRLLEELAALEEMLGRPRFGEGSPRLDLALELFLVDDLGRPLSYRHPLHASLADRAVPAADRFNLALGTAALPLRGEPFRALAAELTASVGALRAQAVADRARVVTAGILPTLRADDLRADDLLSQPRYQALVAGVRRTLPPGVAWATGGLIQGEEPLELLPSWNEVVLAATRASCVVTVDVPPMSLPALAVAGMVASAPALAVAVNAPLFLGRKLWHDTRAALVEPPGRHVAEGSAYGRQPFGRHWPLRGPTELFREAVFLHEPVLPSIEDPDAEPLRAARLGEVPSLSCLALHQQTFFRWVRPVFDARENGRLRLELRALPSGPSIVDSVANAAFLLGVLYGLEDEARTLAERFPLQLAERNFLRAARLGLDAVLDWPDGGSGRTRSVPVTDLVLELLPVARDGLAAAGATEGDVEAWLGVIDGRVRTGQTGAAWQRRLLVRLEADLSRARALDVLLGRYMQLADEGAPVHLWPT